MNLIYPSICLHCKDATKSSKNPLCENCLSSLEKPTKIDFEFIRGLKGLSSSFIHFEAIKTLLFEFKYRNTAYLSKGIAAFMAIDILKRNFPIPDYLIPIPQTYLRTLLLGLNPSLLIAKELGKLLDVPVVSCLKRRWGYPLQEHLPIEKRRHFNPEILFVKKGAFLENKTVLLIDDEMVTGATLRGAALCLKQYAPKAVYGAVFSVRDSCLSV